MDFVFLSRFHRISTKQIILFANKGNLLDRIIEYVWSFFFFLVVYDDVAVLEFVFSWLPLSWCIQFSNADKSQTAHLFLSKSFEHSAKQNEIEFSLETIEMFIGLFFCLFLPFSLHFRSLSLSFTLFFRTFCSRTLTNAVSFLFCCVLLLIQNMCLYISDSIADYSRFFFPFVRVVVVVVDKCAKQYSRLSISYRLISMRIACDGNVWLIKPSHQNRQPKPPKHQIQWDNYHWIEISKLSQCSLKWMETKCVQMCSHKSSITKMQSVQPCICERATERINERTNGRIVFVCWIHHILSVMSETLWLFRVFFLSLWLTRSSSVDFSSASWNWLLSSSFYFSFTT